MNLRGGEILEICFSEGYVRKEIHITQQLYAPGYRLTRGIRVLIVKYLESY